MERVIVKLIFGHREWTPKQSREWATERGYKILAVKSNDDECTVELVARHMYFQSTIVKISIEGEIDAFYAWATLRAVQKTPL